MPPIVSKFSKVDSTVVNGIKAQTSRQITFEYAASGLKIRMIPGDHQNFARYLDGQDKEFYTFTPIQARW